MKCTYCGNEIPSGEETTGEGVFFCNTIHRYSWKQSGSQSIVAAGANVSKPILPTIPSKTDLPRKIIGSLAYSAASYFFLVVLLGALMGGIAGVEAGKNGQDAAEAGRIAGENFSRTYGLFILILCIILSTVGSFKGYLPLTTSSKQ